MTPRRIIRRRSGLTLIEVISALTILLIGVSVTVASVKTATTLSKNQRYMGAAIALAEARVEALLQRHAGSPDLAVGSHGPLFFDAQGAPEDPGLALFEVEWSVGEHASIDGMIDLTVAVAWDEGDQRRSLKLETIREGNP